MKKIDNQQKEIKYTDIKDFLKDKGYIQEQICIDETNEIVNKSSLAKGATGTVIYVYCPARYKITIVGRNQLLDDQDINMAHAIRIRLADEKGEEIAPDTRIRMKKAKPSQEITVIANMLYKDIAITDFQKDGTNKMKSDTDWYRLNEGVFINGEEHLEIDVVNPDKTIDSNNINLAIDIDFWEEEWIK